jgi:hypothetical protein
MNNEEMGLICTVLSVSINKQDDFSGMYRMSQATTTPPYVKKEREKGKKDLC